MELTKSDAPAPVPEDARVSEAEIESRIDGIGGLVNLYRAIMGKDCERNVALGVTTSAVSSLLAERATLTQQVEELLVTNATLEALSRSLASPLLSPCGHSSIYAVTNDGGKTIQYLMCREATLTADNARLVGERDWLCLKSPVCPKSN